MPGAKTLVLEVIKRQDHLSMSIFEGGEIAATLKHFSEHPVSFPEINSVCREISSAFEKAGRGQAENLNQSLKNNGQFLWDQLLARSVKERLKSTHADDLILSIDEELINIPWEILHDSREFLCLKFNLGRLILTKDKFSASRYRSVANNALKMLILANPTGDLKSAYSEGRHIKNQFDRKVSRVRIDFKSTSIDRLYVKKNLREYDIIHFAGHCEHDPINPDGAGWLLSDGKFTPADIFSLSESASLPNLIFSNACHSAQAEEKDAFQEKNYSLACAFLFSGVRHYIGALHKIEDQASLIFAREFYSRLIEGNSVGESLRRARLKLIEVCGGEKIFWANYLLYGDPNFSLFKASPRKENFKINFTILKKLAAIGLPAVVLVFFLTFLFLRLPTKDPKVYLSFMKVKEMFLAGKNEQVISSTMEILKRDPAYLAAYQLLSDTYQRLGDREKALKYSFEYALQAEKKKDAHNLASAYIDIGWIYQARGEPKKAYEFYDKALSLAKKNRDRLNEALALRKTAVWHIDKDEYDVALALLTKSAEINRKMQHRKDYLYNLACDYFDIGLVFENKDDYQAAKEFYNKSAEIFSSLRLKSELSDYYFNLGEIYLFEKQYQAALASYQKGVEIDKQQNNLASLAVGYDMMGELMFEMGNSERAKGYFEQALALCKQINAVPESASVYYNLGLLEKEAGQRSRAWEYFRLAQEIYRKIDSPEYINIRSEFLELSGG